ncbi:hypothetical protein AWZ03_013611 [Drosophila navojoa]|uniref:Uncharacterized protein n=1 Tax=Drosophila navojoa TaxID=7232 RepID=A0A484ATE5_DRONA|nr:hypothetical protein AWZ03_013611 [Drosophila navojoa]
MLRASRREHATNDNALPAQLEWEQQQQHQQQQQQQLQQQLLLLAAYLSIFMCACTPWGMQCTARRSSRSSSSSRVCASGIKKIEFPDYNSQQQQQQLQEKQQQEQEQKAALSRRRKLPTLLIERRCRRRCWRRCPHAAAAAAAAAVIINIAGITPPKLMNAKGFDF